MKSPEMSAAANIVRRPGAPPWSAWLRLIMRGIMSIALVHASRAPSTAMLPSAAVTWR